MLKKNRQEITPGGIILVHGNSNEHKGITLLLPLLNKLTLLGLRSIAALIKRENKPYIIEACCYTPSSACTIKPRSWKKLRHE